MAKNDGKINWGLFYFHRWWRITPTYMIVLAVWATLFLQWGRGPGHNGISGYINGVCKIFGGPISCTSTICIRFPGILDWYVIININKVRPAD